MKSSLSLAALLLGVTLSVAAQTAPDQSSAPASTASPPAAATAADPGAAAHKAPDVAAPASAATPAPAPAPAATPAPAAVPAAADADESPHATPVPGADEPGALDPARAQAITRTLEQRLPGIHIDGVRTTPMPGIYEVQVGMDLFYTDATADYVLQGSLIDVKARRDLTAERLTTLQQVPFASLPLKDAIKIVKGSGTHKVATFEDPNCPYCKQLHHTLESVNDVTVYVFLFPILTADSPVKARNIWCAADRAKAWTDWMVHGKEPATADCSTPLDANLALGHKLNVQGTPTLIFADGTRATGALPLDALQKRLAAAKP